MKADLPSGMLWLGIGVFVAYEGYDLGLGVPSDPGSGFVLFWAGLLMAGLALVQLAASVRGHGGGPIAAMWPGPSGGSRSRRSWRWRSTGPFCCPSAS